MGVRGGWMRYHSLGPSYGFGSSYGGCLDRGSGFGMQGVQNPQTTMVTEAASDTLALVPESGSPTHDEVGNQLALVKVNIGYTSTSLTCFHSPKRTRHSRVGQLVWELGTEGARIHISLRS